MKITHVIMHTIFLTVIVWVLIFFGGNLLKYNPQYIPAIIWIIIPVVSFLLVLFLHFNSMSKKD